MAAERAGDKSVMDSWTEWQRRFWQEWMTNAGKGLEQMMSLWRLDPGQMSPWVSEWWSLWRNAMGPAAGAGTSSEHLGQEVFGRLLDAGKVYQDLLGFWSRVMAPMAKLSGGATLTTEDLKEMKDRWLKEYQVMMESLWGRTTDKDVQDTLKSLTSAATVAGEQTFAALEPVFKNLEQLPAILQKIARGERAAVTELSGIFRKNYQDTIGKVLRAPSLGFSREIIERVNKAIDAYIEFNVVLAQYQSLFAATGLQAGEKVFARLSEFQGRELTPETFREFYRLWWTINEETYHDFFVTPEFIGLLQEVLRRGLLFRKWFDDLTGELFQMINIPTKADMDEIYQALYELRKEVRWQRREIAELEKKVGVEVKKPRPRGGERGGRPGEEIEHLLGSFFLGDGDDECI
jgi:class III poly(R)-hydroxyalkanoic acid synthase PhaE subunit